MPWVKGSDQRDNWHHMNVPPWTGTCAKFQQGRLLMQRYQFIHNYFKGSDLYAHHSVWAKERSVELAKRMVEHAKNCAVCMRENRLREDDFYGVYK